MDTMKILITSNSFGKFDNQPLASMEARGWEIIKNPYGKILNENEMMELVKDVDAIILGSDPVTKKVLERANKLKVISRYGVGIDNIDLDEAKLRGIAVERTVNANAAAVSDYTIGLILTTLRHISATDAKLKEGKWVKYTGLDLHEKTVGIFGLGAIGRGVVERLSGFGCKFLAFDPYFDKEFCEKYDITVTDEGTIFKQANIISLHYPGNANDKPLIGKRELELMSPNTVIINTARASLVDENEIVQALNAGKLYGYGTDVFSSEPEIPEVFIGQDKVVLSPHMAAVSVGAVNKMTAMAVDNIFKHFNKEEKD